MGTQGIFAAEMTQMQYLHDHIILMMDDYITGRVILMLECLNTVKMNKVSHIILQNAMIPKLLMKTLEVITEKEMMVALLV